MFTGIVEDLGEVVSVATSDPSDLSGSGSPSAARVTIRSAPIAADAAIGDSIAVSGTCLTVVDLGAAGPVDDPTAGTFTADIMAETLRRTTAGDWQPGTRVNLERSVTPTTRLGGHLVQGHIDGVGTLTGRTEHPGYDDVAITVPHTIGRYLAPQGAVAVDGISLTVIEVTDHARGSATGLAAGANTAAGADPAADAASMTTFTVGVIPETRRATTMGSRTVGGRVNIEVDVMAKYAERLLTPQPSRY